MVNLFVFFFFQLNGLDISLENMWDSASEEVHQTYGRKYLDHLKKFIKDGIQSSHENTHPILEAMHHAIQNSAPKFRYLIGGGKFLIDINTVRNFFNFTPLLRKMNQLLVFGKFEELEYFHQYWIFFI